MPGRAFRVTATGIAYDGGSDQDQAMIGARLVSGSDVAKAVIRENDASGAILAELQCAAESSDETLIPIIFRKSLHVTLTGTGPSCSVYV